MKRNSKQTILNLALFGFLISELVRTAGYISISGQGGVMGLMVGVLLIQSVMAVIRAPAASKPEGAVEYVIPFLAAFGPMLFFLLGEGNQSEFALFLQYFGALGMLFSSINLGRSFAIFPMQRDIVSAGVYRWVRHPLYLSYIIFDASILFAFEGVIAKLFFITEVAFLIWRIELEEKHLTKRSRAFRAYKESTRYRLAPGLY